MYSPYAAAERKIQIIAVPSPPFSEYSNEILDDFRRSSSESYFRGWYSYLQEEKPKLRVVRKVHESRFKEHPALRMDIAYEDPEDHSQRSSYGLFFLGRQTTYFVVAQGDAAGLAKANELLESFYVEPK